MRRFYNEHIVIEHRSRIDNIVFLKLLRELLREDEIKEFSVLKIST